jgi:hypothetical protein
VEIFYDGQEIFPDLKAWANEKTADGKIEILHCQDDKYLSQVLTLEDETKPLDELDEYHVFDRLLEKSEIPAGQKEELANLYKEIVLGINIEN